MPEAGAVAEIVAPRGTNAGAEHQVVPRSDEELVIKFTRPQPGGIMRKGRMFAGTGIRVLREQPVYTSPNVFPPAGFEQQEV